VTRALRKVGFDTDRIVRLGYQRNTMDLDAAVSAFLKRRGANQGGGDGAHLSPGRRLHQTHQGRGDESDLHERILRRQQCPGLKELGSKYAEGLIVTQVVPFYGSSETGVLEYRDRLAQYFPAGLPGFVSLEGYIAAKVLCTALQKAGPELTTERLVEALEAINGLDFGIGTRVSFGPSEHQGSHKVWATLLDGNFQFVNLDLD
jgi:hypothetical protein